MFTDILKQVVARRNLTEEEAAAAVEAILSGTLSDAQIGAFMAAMATKGETIEELAGAARAMRRKACRLQVTASRIVDTCGTGGDGGGTFNISTTTAFVVAGAGVTVAKHGNRSVSSRCGSADVLEALGMNLAVEPEIVEEAINAIGIGFMFAPMYHSAMKHAMPVRKQLGIRSIFNMLGPLTNPAAATCQLLGVYAPELTEMFANALKLLGTRRAFVVHGHDGLDEISICAPTRVSELTEGGVKTYDLDPTLLIGDYADPAEMAGGDAATNARIMQGILTGELQGGKRQVVLVNAAAALTAAGVSASLTEGLAVAAEAIDSGAAEGKLQELVAFTQRG